MKIQMKSIVALFVFGAALVFSGCSTSQQNGVLMPGADLGMVKKYYVVHLPADSRGINTLIKDDLVRRGYVATTGEAADVPPDADATVTYQDKWMWDITMYLLQLDIQFRKPKSDIPLATGTSLRTSLVRLGPAEMVKEVLDTIYSKAGVGTAAPMGK